MPLVVEKQLGCACAPSVLPQFSAGELSVNNSFNKLHFFFKVHYFMDKEQA